ncbi:hypothetical protein PG999_011882 [Apiospora kogelbergensis]|uniref:Nephrocystin 3-like N-terminal domain-containing protein n=1 Tax=Apiospora kogelbergensis TaxID=1337665 RepID=A0AAW0QED5_9PEZI
MHRFKPNHSNEPQPSRLARLGFHIIEDKDPGSAEAIDIVAIHGLNGHWDTTWTDEATNKNWLKDFLPLKFPSARVLSFSYNSVVQFSKAVADISDFAEQLLTGLDSIRTTVAEQGRPLFFICHSLGGIAFNRIYEGEQYLHLRGPIQGVAFFGTPHRGSNVASFGGIFGRILKSFSLGTSTNLKLLKDLEVECMTQAYLGLRCHWLRIVSFYELDKLPFMSSLVVEKESAVLGAKHERAIPTDGDHRTICRFSSMEEPRMRTVLTELRSLIKQDLSKRQQVKQETFLKSLGPNSYRQHKDRNPPAVPGTCSWILCRKEYTNWLQSPISSLIWLSANPGCGKSVTCSFLIDNMERGTGSASTLVCYWFFKSDNTQQRSAVSALRGLLRQVMEAQPRMTAAVETAMARKPLDNIPNLWKALTVATGCDQNQATSGQTTDDKLQQKNIQVATICIVDGLDECDISDKKELLKVISEFYQEVGRCNSPTRGSLKMLVASRPENSIKVVFDKLRNSTKFPSGAQAGSLNSYGVIRLKGEDESELISGDISLVVSAAIKDLIDQGLPENLLSRIEKQLILRADRTFLWITLILQLLAEKVEAGASRRELEEILQSRDIDSLFVELFISLPDVPRTRKMFSIILAAIEPLSVEQLSIALAVKPRHDALDSSAKPFRPGPQNLDELEYDVVYPHENHIRAIGGHFIRIIQDKVYFVHETAREFLLKEDRQDSKSSLPDSDFEEITLFEVDMEPTLCSEPTFGTEVNSKHSSQSIWYQSFSSTSCAALLLDICVTYIYMIGKSARQPQGLEENEHLLAFLPYAARSWWQHFQLVSPRIRSFNVPYYQNLCHPLFPGFAIWIAEYLDNKESLLFGLSAEEEQDYYIAQLGIGSIEYNEERKERDHDQVSAEKLSSNPTAANHYFPLDADENGFVAPNFSRVSRPRTGL